LHFEFKSLNWFIEAMTVDLGPLPFENKKLILILRLIIPNNSGERNFALQNTSGKD
jgi:hypothetical protein